MGLTLTPAQRAEAWVREQVSRPWLWTIVGPCGHAYAERLVAAILCPDEAPPVPPDAPCAACSLAAFRGAGGTLTVVHDSDLPDGKPS